MAIENSTLPTEAYLILLRSRLSDMREETGLLRRIPLVSVYAQAGDEMKAINNALTELRGGNTALAAGLLTKAIEDNKIFAQHNYAVALADAEKAYAALTSLVGSDRLPKQAQQAIQDLRRR